MSKRIPSYLEALKKVFPEERLQKLLDSSSKDLVLGGDEERFSNAIKFVLAKGDGRMREVLRHVAVGPGSKRKVSNSDKDVKRALGFKGERENEYSNNEFVLLKAAVNAFNGDSSYLGLSAEGEKRIEQAKHGDVILAFAKVLAEAVLQNPELNIYYGVPGYSGRKYNVFGGGLQSFVEEFGIFGLFSILSLCPEKDKAIDNFFGNPANHQLLASEYERISHKYGQDSAEFKLINLMMLSKNPAAIFQKMTWFEQGELQINKERLNVFADWVKGEPVDLESHGLAEFRDQNSSESSVFQSLIEINSRSWQLNIIGKSEGLAEFLQIFQRALNILRYAAQEKSNFDDFLRLPVEILKQVRHAVKKISLQIKSLQQGTQEELKQFEGSISISPAKGVLVKSFKKGLGLSRFRQLANNPKFLMAKMMAPYFDEFQNLIKKLIHKKQVAEGKWTDFVGADSIDFTASEHDEWLSPGFFPDEEGKYEELAQQVENSPYLKIGEEASQISKEQKRRANEAVAEFSSSDSASNVEEWQVTGDLMSFELQPQKPQQPDDEEPDLIEFSENQNPEPPQQKPENQDLMTFDGDSQSSQRDISDLLHKIQGLYENHGSEESQENSEFLAAHARAAAERAAEEESRQGQNAASANQVPNSKAAVRSNSQPVAAKQEESTLLTPAL